MLCHANSLFEIHFGTKNLVFALCPAQQTNTPGAHDGAALARTFTACRACEEDPPDLPVELVNKKPQKYTKPLTPAW